MITGKNSAWKGFGLMIWFVVALLALIGTTLKEAPNENPEPVCIVAAVILFAWNIYLMYTLYKDWSDGC